MTKAEAPRNEGVATRSTKDLVKAAVSGWMGTAMEFMDFQLYSLAAAIVFNKIFFPNVSPAIGLIAAFATYGVGYVARLVGAIYFGRMGDRIGRKKVLFITIALMGALHHPDRRPAHLRHRRHLGADPAGRAAAGPGLRGRRRDRRRHRDARRVRTEEATRHHRLAGLAWAPTPAPWPRPPSGRCCSACSPRNSCSAGAGGFRSCSASSCWASPSGCGPTSRRARSSRNAPTSSTVSP